MSGVNTCIFIGNLGQDPEITTSQAGKSIGKFSIAVNERRKNSDGEWVDDTTWVNVVCFGNTADAVGRFLRKGSKVYVEGRFSSRSYEDRNTGQKRYWTEIKAHNIVFLDSRQDREQGGGGYGPPQGGGGYGGGYGGGQHQGGGYGAPPQQQRPPAQGSLDPNDDNIPF